MSEQQTLKPCPFCNVDCTEMNYNGAVYFVACRNCSALGPAAITETRAITAWNDRAAIRAAYEDAAKVCDHYAEVMEPTDELSATMAEELAKAIRARAEEKP